jgi:hypothetical protein
LQSRDAERNEMKTTIDMAREAGFDVVVQINAVDGSIAHLTAFAALVRADEREACAKVCEEAISSIWEFHPEYVNEVGRNVCTNLATAIRAMGETK